MFHSGDFHAEPHRSEARRPILRFAGAQDDAALDSLFIAAFGSKAEALLVRRLRADDDLLFTIVAIGVGAGKTGSVIGAACFSRVELRSPPEQSSDTGPAPLTALAPLAVATPWRGRGLGAALVRAGAVQARKRGVAAILARGDRRFYEPIGFTSRLVAKVATPWPQSDVRGLALSSEIDRLQGDAYFPRAFFGEGEAPSIDGVFTAKPIIQNRFGAGAAL